VRPTRRADNSAVLVVMNVKVRMKAQHSITPLSLHDLLWESFTFIWAGSLVSHVGEAHRLRVHENMVLRGILWPERDKVTG
jgi:hypothetical protein